MYQTQTPQHMQEEQGAALDSSALASGEDDPGGGASKESAVKAHRAHALAGQEAGRRAGLRGRVVNDAEGAEEG